MATLLISACIASLATRAAALNFTISNGQIFTPGFAILDSPQPGTPMGGGEFATIVSGPLHTLTIAE